MKILIISNLYPPHVLGGYEILCAQVVSHLEKRGHRIHILTSSHGSSESTPGITRSMELFTPFSEKATDFSRKARAAAARHNYAAVRQVIAETAPDLIFVWSLLRLTPAPARAAEDSGLPTVYTFNDENIAGYLPAAWPCKPKHRNADSRNPAVRDLVRWGIDRFVTPQITLRGLAFRRTTCISRKLRDNLVGRGMAVSDSRIIYQGIPLEQFPPKEPRGAVHSPAALLYAGQLHSYKGVHTLIEAAGRLAAMEKAPEFTVTIAGEGPPDYTAELKRAAESAGPKIDFLGRIPHSDMGPVYRNHDILVFPSIWEEPFGLTHLEAMASGTAVVSTANGGQGEFLENRENALVFPPDNPAALADALFELLGSPELYRKLVEEGRRTAVEMFSFTRYVDEIEELLTETRQSAMERKGRD